MNKNYCLAIVLLIMFITPVITFAKDAVPGWRTPMTNELGKDMAWRDKDPNLYLVVKADFDGDGKEDIAYLLVNSKDNSIGLFVVMASVGNARPLQLEIIKDKQLIEVFGIGIVRPGTYETACGKGFWDCKKGEQEYLNLNHPAIDFFNYESANSYFYWNTIEEKFDRIWISD